MTERPAVIPLRIFRSGTSTLLIRIPRAPGLLAEGLTEPCEQFLLGLGPTSALELHTLAAKERTTASVAAVLDRLADAAERATTAPRLLDHVVLTGGGAISRGLRALLSSYTRTLTWPEHAAEVLTASTPPVDLVVTVTNEALDLDRCAAWAARAAAVLPIVVRGDVVVIGPLLGAAHSPCARCIELHRIDRDPRRSELLTAPDPGLHDADQLDLDPAHAAVAIGLVGTLVRCLSRGVPIPPALSLTARMPYPQIGHHAWTPHPRCGCASRPV